MRNEQHKAQKAAKLRQSTIGHAVQTTRAALSTFEADAGQVLKKDYGVLYSGPACVRPPWPALVPMATSGQKNIAHRFASAWTSNGLLP